jgi:hypothetical protein
VGPAFGTLRRNRGEPLLDDGGTGEPATTAALSLDHAALAINKPALRALSPTPRSKAALKAGLSA